MKTFKIILNLFFVATTKLTMACDCVGQLTVESQFKSADIVVIGNVISFTPIHLADSSTYLTYNSDSTLHHGSGGKIIFAYDIKVISIVKGKKNIKTITLLTGNGHGDCGFKFEVGEKYIIYANTKSYFEQQSPQGQYVHYKDQNVFWTSICSRTVSFNKEELKSIKKVSDAK